MFAISSWYTGDDAQFSSVQTFALFIFGAITSFISPSLAVKYSVHLFSPIVLKWSCDSESTRWQLSVASMLEQHHAYGIYQSMISGVDQNKIRTELNAILATLFSRESAHTST